MSVAFVGFLMYKQNKHRPLRCSSASRHALATTPSPPPTPPTAARRAQPSAQPLRRLGLHFCAHKAMRGLVIFLETTFLASHDDCGRRERCSATRQHLLMRFDTKIGLIRQLPPRLSCEHSILRRWSYVLYLSAASSHNSALTRQMTLKLTDEAKLGVKSHQQALASCAAPLTTPAVIVQGQNRGL